MCQDGCSSSLRLVLPSIRLGNDLATLVGHTERELAIGKQRVLKNVVSAAGTAKGLGDSRVGTDHNHRELESGPDNANRHRKIAVVGNDQCLLKAPVHGVSE